MNTSSSSSLCYRIELLPHPQTLDKCGRPSLWGEETGRIWHDNCGNCPSPTMHAITAAAIPTAKMADDLARH
jgi:hypothetical protein